MRTTFVSEERGTALAAGGLYVLATAAGVAAVAVDAPTRVAAMAERSGAVLLTALLIAVMGVAVAGVAVMLTPVLVRDAGTRARQGVALGYAGSRIAEGTIFLVGSAALVAMLAVSEAMASAPIGLGAAYEAAVAALQEMVLAGWLLVRGFAPAAGATAVAA